MTNKLILVTGASGYIASRLIPRLLENGYRVRCLVRNPLRLKGRNWCQAVEMVQGDVMAPSTLAPALKDVHSAYYLIHNMSSGRGYTARELEGARNFASAAEHAGVEHIIYLGGLADPEQHIAPHMRSRIETGSTLRQGKVPVTEFRAGVIAGSGSISFEMIRFMTELFPLITGPAWLNNRSQPIAAQNVIDYLFTALENHDGHGQVFEIGGPEITTYGDLMLRYARLRGLHRRLALLPYIPLWFMAFGVGWVTPVPSPIAFALVGGLSADSVVQHNEARRVFPSVQLVVFDEAARNALEQLSPARIERVWDDGQTGAKSIKHEGFFIEHEELHVRAAPGNVFQVITQLGGRYGWPYLNFLWQLRGRLDGLLGGYSSLPQGAGVRDLRVGDAIDYYRVEALEPSHLLRLHSELKAPGEGWMEWRVEPHEDGARLIQAAFFAPRGLPGFIYWVALYPFHQLVFRGLIRAIARRTLSA